MSTIQTADINIPSDPATIRIIKEACLEFEKSAKAVADQKLQQKAIIEALFEKTEIPKKYLKKLATLYYKQNRDQVFAETEATDAFYHRVFVQEPTTQTPV